MDFKKMNVFVASRVYNWIHTGNNEKISCIVKLNKNDARVIKILNDEKLNFGGSIAKLRITLNDIPVSKIAEISDWDFVDYIESHILHYTS